jgi:hypothetical protein
MNEIIAIIGVGVGIIIFYVGMLYERTKWHKTNGFEE